MKRSLYFSFILLALTSCKNQGDFTIPTDTKFAEIQFSINNKTYTLHKKNDECKINALKNIKCEVKKVKKWLEKINGINFINNKNTTSIIGKEKDFIKINTSNNNYQFNITKLLDNCHVIYSKDNNKKVGYISNEDCGILIRDKNDFRPTQLLSHDEYDKVYYVQEKNKKQLNDKQQKLVLDVLKSAKFSKYLFEGNIDMGIKKQYNIHINRNNNILGKLIFIKDGNEEIFSFGRQYEGKPQINILNESTGNIREYKVLGWLKLYSLIRDL